MKFPNYSPVWLYGSVIQSHIIYRGSRALEPSLYIHIIPMAHNHLNVILVKQPLSLRILLFSHLLALLHCRSFFLSFHNNLVILIIFFFLFSFFFHQIIFIHSKDDGNCMVDIFDHNCYTVISFCSELYYFFLLLRTGECVCVCVSFGHINERTSTTVLP